MISSPAIAALLLTVAASTVSAEAGPRAVLELFTSQGCSSCPPADKLLAKYAADGDVVALSFPVDYWDYLGWKDTLASHDNTERQRAYSTTRGDRKVYTPQVVVNGVVHAVGSDEAAIEAAVTKAGGLPVEVSVTPEGDTLRVSIGAAVAGSPKRATVWLVLFDSAIPVEIAGGENDNRSVTYTNVVRKMHRIAMWKGEALTVNLPRSAQEPYEHDGCAVLLQDENVTGLPGRVYGAAILVTPDT